MKKLGKILAALAICILLVCLCATPAFAASRDVAGAIQGAGNDDSEQIKTVVNMVIFPAIDLILAVFFFAKLATA